ncbi:MAG: prepilin-type N-terminal cleavage/methylation domain-containing protein [Planctomycetes bacterium]|nr:prepilin-type N-terminal cleavage/methylation domain-containing protein [Planctomycetota bacterium]
MTAQRYESTCERSGRNGGFTLLELMIVVAIVAIIAAVAIPVLRATRISGNEASAVSSLRVLSSVSEQYRARYGVYPGAMPDLVTVGYVDPVLAAGTKSGYDFAYTGAPATWECAADPQVVGRTGERYFFCDLSGVIRFETAGTATATSSPID